MRRPPEEPLTASTTPGCGRCSLGSRTRLRDAGLLERLLTLADADPDGPVAADGPEAASPTWTPAIGCA